MPTASRKTTTQRGLGDRHKRQAAYLKSPGVHVEGTPCWWCGEPMYLAQGLHADHSTPRSHGGVLADRLLHTAHATAHAATATKTMNDQPSPDATQHTKHQTSAY